MKIAWSEELTLRTAASEFQLFGLLKGHSLSNAPVNLSFMFSLVLRCLASSLYAGCVGCARESFISVPRDWNIGRSALSGRGRPLCTDRETEYKLLFLLLELAFLSPCPGTSLFHHIPVVLATFLYSSHSFIDFLKSNLLFLLH